MIKTPRRYLVEQEIISIVLNFAINVFVAWFLFRNLKPVPLWGDLSIMGDTIVTCFVLPFFVCGGLTKQIKKHVEKKKVAPIKWSALDGGILSFLPRHYILRSITMGILSMAIIVPPTFATFETLGVSQMTFSDFVVFKSCFATVLAAVLTPLIIIRALRDAGLENGDT